MKNFNVQDLAISDLGVRAELPALLACPTNTYTGITCPFPSCFEPSSAFGRTSEEGLAMLQEQLRRALRESEAPS